MGSRGKKKREKKQHNIQDLKKETNKLIFTKDNIQLFIAIASFLLSIASLGISCKMQSEINIFTENMGSLNYNPSIAQTPETINSKDLFNNQTLDTISTYDENPFTISPFIITKGKDKYSGNYGKCYFATVMNNNIDLIEFDDDFVGNIFNNGCIITISLENNNKNNDDTFEFFYSPGPHNKWSIFHIIIQGYNGEKAYYTLVCGCKNNRHIIDSELFTQENLYDRNNVESFIQKSSLEITTDELIEKVENERKLLRENLD